MNSKYNVLVRYLGDGEFKFTIKKLGEVSISKSKPVYIYNADVETINDLRTLRKMLIEITIGAKPTGAFKVYNFDEINKKEERLRDTRIVADRRGTESLDNNDIKSILSSGSNGPIIEEVSTPVEKKAEEKPKTTRKTTKKSTKSKKTTKSKK